MGLVHSLLTACWNAGDTHIVISPAGGWAHAHARPRILFYEKHKPYYEFTNFSAHAVAYQGRCYPTSEHLFQAFKFIDGHPQIAERIRTCGPKPIRAFDEAHRHKTAVRSDWSQVHVSKMEMVLRLKFTQHAELKQMLLDTGDAELVEDSPRDWFWGIGADGTGSNELGKALMRLRDEIRNEEEQGISAPTPTTTPTPPPPLPCTSKPTGPTPKSTRSQARRASGKRHASRSATHGLCEVCRTKPASPQSRYCSRTCAAVTCKHCQIKQRTRGPNAYCSRTCADRVHGR